GRSHAGRPFDARRVAARAIRAEEVLAETVVAQIRTGRARGAGHRTRRAFFIVGAVIIGLRRALATEHQEQRRETQNEPSELHGSSAGPEATTTQLQYPRDKMSQAPWAARAQRGKKGPALRGAIDATSCRAQMSPRRRYTELGSSSRVISSTT